MILGIFFIPLLSPNSDYPMFTSSSPNLIIPQRFVPLCLAALLAVMLRQAQCNDARVAGA